MIEWAEAREPLASWVAAAGQPLPAAGRIGPVDNLTWVPIAGGRAAMIESATGGWLVCDEEGRVDIDARWDQYGDPATDPLVEVLWRRGLARIGGVGAFDSIDVGAAIEASRQRYTIVLLMSTGCNLACDYCYLGHRHPTPDVAMPIETACASVDAALEQPWNEVMFDFGEVAVAGNRFETVARYALERATTRGKRARIAVQTNATTIDSSLADILRELDAVVGISLDGPAHVHDAARAFRSGAGSYSRVQRALGLLRDRAVPVHLIATIGRHNVGHPIEVVEELVSHEPTSFLLKPVLAEGEAATSWGDAGVAPGEYAEFMTAVMRHAAKHGTKYLDQTAVKFMGRLLGDYNGWRDSCTSRSCGSGRSLHVVDPTGRTHACPRFVDDLPGPTSVAVSIRSKRGSPPSIVAPSLADLLPATLRSAPASCRGCPWLSTCGGGCTLISHDSNLPAIPQPDPHCIAYDDVHHELVSLFLPAYLGGQFEEDPVFNGARTRRLKVRQR